MKLLENSVFEFGDAVAPRTGARIETMLYPAMFIGALVAPRTGARIETQNMDHGASATTVAPRTGARIETTRAIMLLTFS